MLYKHTSIICSSTEKKPREGFNGSSLNRANTNVNGDYQEKLKAEWVGEIDFNLNTGEAKQTLECKVVHPRKIQRLRNYNLSDRTKGKIKQKLYAWFFGSVWKKKGNPYATHFLFYTFTFTGKISHEDAKKCLNLYMTKVRKLYGKFDYLWVAEVQDGKRNGYKHCTGNIHYHMIVNRYFPFKKLNRMWCESQMKYGLKGKNDKGDWYNPLQCSRDDKGNVRFIRTVRGLDNYITKYITKNDDIVISGTWHCSHSISQIFTGRYSPYDAVDNLCQIFETDCIDDIHAKTYYNKYNWIIPVTHINKFYVQLLIPLYRENTKYLLN